MPLAVGPLYFAVSQWGAPHVLHSHSPHILSSHKPNSTTQTPEYSKITETFSNVQKQSKDLFGFSHYNFFSKRLYIKIILKT